MARLKDYNWNISGSDNTDGKPISAVYANLLMDIRDELKELNTTLRVLRCRNFLHIPAKLERIAQQTKKKPTVRRGARTAR